MVQLPSAPRLSGKKRRASCAACCTFARTTPASTVTVLPIASSARMRFIRVSESTIARPELSGVAPPDMLVLPPCGTTGTPCRVQSRITAATSSVEPGLTTARAAPRYLPSQSLRKGAWSCAETRTCASPRSPASSTTRSSIFSLRREAGHPNPAARARSPASPLPASARRRECRARAPAFRGSAPCRRSP